MSNTDSDPPRSPTPIFHWAGTEQNLAMFVTVQEVTIFSISGTVGRRELKGKVVICDYPEGGYSSPHDWIAMETREGWLIKPVLEEGQVLIWRDFAGDPCFTASGEINEALIQFIGQRITNCLEGITEVVIAEYTGKVDPYTGRCRCHDVESFTGASSPMPNELWREIMDGYEHPRYCFECSCGARWWFFVEAESYFRVADDDAWADLLAHNGIFTRLWDVAKDGIYLVRTLRQKYGWIPIA